jgi:histidinol dehydrogenase
MQNQISNWATAAVEIAKLVVPVLPTILSIGSSALVAYLTFRHQRRLEEIKIYGQTRLEARKLMFTSYQQALERSNQSVSEFQKTLAKLQVDIFFPANDEERSEALKAYAIAMSQMINLLGLW